MTAATPPTTFGAVGRFFGAIGSLFKGMGVTIKYFVNPKTVVTQQYPENRETLKMFERFRSELLMTHDENGFHKCTGCRICETACPNGSIKVLHRAKSATGKAELDAFMWRLDSCTFCNACVMVCPFSVLKFGNNFENSVYDRRLFVYNLSKYAGPTSTALAKVADPEERKKMTEPRTPYYGPVPMQGHSWAGLQGVEVPAASAQAETPPAATTEEKKDGQQSTK